ncbi:chromophore lyase CpcT/CpeT [Cyanobium sp. BA20m-p-22]|uniref:chromophore lyase CpcT/CpeT n=1 Tax=Cyanobium sp. BA20m-p-22 TaxID=2823704 RepID=UPI0020CBBB21|nr:chromophore lyase CpcT/CpeT [Cyanobium sp. BA20m-p-22]MCP9909232.1 chromophore lyase CpcT/CpeT [Cyanobium sp. BA20m-p-22]
MPNNALRFSKILAGHYSNSAQSQHDPVNFAHINIYFRPLPWGVFQGPGFYSEQSYGHDPWRPYRQGVHRLISTEKVQIVENYGFDEPIRLAGAGFTPELLKLINIKRLKQRCGCAMHFHETTQGCFSGLVEPGQKCLVPRDGRPTYLVSEVLVDHENWISRDQGFDPATDALQWGSEHGALRFKRIASYENEVAAEWRNLTNDQGDQPEHIG